ncbi:acireductone synthase [Streptomyces sp. LE64]|uniref:acireductone synthase n=1 Tax=Streptomyces sp. LE64 TaxID=3448653 RepID=UPI0040418AE7
MIELRAEVVALDIEGTIGSLSHVRDVLFPYARRRLSGWLHDHAADPRLAELLADVRRESGRPGLDAAGARAVLAAWADQDVKAAPLKRLQGWIWAEGYADGSLHGHVYPEVPAALRRWRADGIRVHTYSSGSAAAQLDWFRHTAHGDLSVLFGDRFDLENAGPKGDPESYRRIAGLVGAPAASCVFLSDVGAELDAAARAGWRSIGVRRENDPRGPRVPDHITVPDLDALSLRPAHVPTPDGTLGEVPFA